jgi:hypothetical protein
LFRGIFVCYRGAWLLANNAKLGVLFAIINLDYEPIGIER